MPNPRTVVRRHPFPVFVALAALFGWSIFIAAWLGAPTEVDNMPLGPLAAAALVTAALGRDTFRGWARRLRSWSAPPRWYAVAVLTPFAVDVGIVIANSLLGAPLPTSGQLSGWTSIPAGFVVMLVMVGIGEEAGWSAFAAPHLLRRHGVFTTWALMAAARTLWHLPLLLSGMMPFPVWLIGNASFQAVALWVLLASDGRWTLLAVWHATLNAFGGGFFFRMVTGADNTRLGLFLSLAYAALAAALFTVPHLRSRAVRPAALRAGEPRAEAGGYGSGLTASPLVVVNPAPDRIRYP